MSGYTWANLGATCPYCGCVPTHSATACPSVSEIEYFENGTIKRIVKRGPLDYWRMPMPDRSAASGEGEG